MRNILDTICTENQNT